MVSTLAYYVVLTVPNTSFPFFRSVASVQCSAETPQKMLSKYAALSSNEIPYQIEQILTGKDGKLD